MNIQEFWAHYTDKLNIALDKKATSHQITTMLATSKNVLVPGHNHLLTTCADDPSLYLSPLLALGWLAGNG